MASGSVLRRAGFAAGALGALAAVVLLAPAGPKTVVGQNRPAAATAHAPDIGGDLPRAGRSVPESAEAFLAGYVDPDGTLPPSATTAALAVAEEAYLDPERDLPALEPLEADADMGEYVDPEAAP